MKTDNTFYRLFQEFPNIFFELIGSSPNEAENYQFTSQEVKQLAFRIDGLFLPTTDELAKPFYLVEVQFQPDDTLYYRLFSELFLYLKQYQVPHPWQVVVIYPDRRIEREQAIHFGDILSLERVTRIYLDELGEQGELSLSIKVVKLITETPTSVGEKAVALIQQARQQLSDEAILRNLIDLVETIIIYKLPDKTWEEVKAMFGLNELKQTKVFQEAYELACQEVYQEVKLEAYQEAKSTVELETKLESIPRMLQFGLSTAEMAQLLDLTLEVVQQEVQKIQQESE
jgi:predicted transposase/invertase (TIGR01784 family)